MKMKSILIPAAAILLAAALLLGVNLATSGLRAANIQAEHLRMMQTLLPGSGSFVREPYAGADENIRSVHRAENGFVVETCVNGYVDEISMMIGVSSEGRVTGLVVRDMNETFGLGAKALTDHVFLSGFLNSSGNAVIHTGTDAASSATGEADAAAGDGEVLVDAITGATVTSRAIARSVNSAVAAVTGADAASSATSWGG